MGEITVHLLVDRKDLIEKEKLNTSERVENRCNNVLESSRGDEIYCTSGRKNSFSILREKIEVWDTDAGNWVCVG